MTSLGNLDGSGFIFSLKEKNPTYRSEGIVHFRKQKSVDAPNRYSGLRLEELNFDFSTDFILPTKEIKTFDVSYLLHTCTMNYSQFVLSLF